MIKSLRTYLYDFIAMRTEEIGNNVLKQDEGYRELSKELQSLLKEIFKCVPIDRHPTIFSYEEKEQAQLALAIEIMYRQGLIDGVFLNRRLSVVMENEDEF
ncbi:hypothetical protein GCM10008018_36370 [Paenibacillus marchantiophytorum]|uniref:Uncharacterized protein n=1 Tax=Paenibacillus marchantiophytorum TaxID=1619310 RepID=A0ABQ1EUC2_9BACL|nr:hypothetical protein [Paenibacillus marchantiophytorum]GFZ86963.1 hypothetical protein GCM10008018_36370 [Paenibacillus marchantiophytorum]